MENQLLTIGAALAGAWENAKNFFLNFSVLYCIEIILMFTMIFFVSKVLRDNDSTKLMWLYWILILVGGVIHVIDPAIMDKQFYFLFVVIISATMFLLFSAEVKKYFWDVHDAKDATFEKREGGAEVRSQEDTERCIKEIVRALQNMSKNSVGALIVFSKGSLPKQVLQHGIQIDSEISSQMIEGVFFPKSPLHDGAMVIRGHKIQAASCVLPLTQKTSYPKEFGTRHRAALGISEATDAIVLIVSEETGIISTAREGKLTRHLDAKGLRSILDGVFTEGNSAPLLMNLFKRKEEANE
jgi:diadenylate cyclase